MLQTVHQTASGVDPETGYTTGEVMAGRIEDPHIVRLIERQLSNQRANTTEQLLPVYDDRGNIVAFERAADPSKLVNLNKSTDLPAMIGVWRGRQAEELMAQTVNEELIEKLYDRWIIDQRAGRANEYVNIAQLGASDDRILQEAARLIPKGSRDYIKNRFGRDVFMVRRDMLLDTFGARQASVGDLFTGKTRWDPKVGKKFEEIAIGMMGKKAYPWLVSAEKNVQEFVTNAKHLIVVKSVIVPVANIVSNFFQLLNRGVPLRSIIEGAGRKTAELNFYIKSRDKELGLEAELRAAKAVTNFVSIRKLEAELQSIRDSQKRLSIWPLIEAGEFSAISNGEVTAEDLALADGKWTNFVERKISELPDGIRTVARYALVTRDTALYQGLARSVQYGDFVAHRTYEQRSAPLARHPYASPRAQRGHAQQSARKWDVVMIPIACRCARFGSGQPAPAHRTGTGGRGGQILQPFDNETGAVVSFHNQEIGKGVGGPRRCQANA